MENEQNVQNENNEVVTETVNNETVEEVAETVSEKIEEVNTVKEETTSVMGSYKKDKKVNKGIIIGIILLVLLIGGFLVYKFVFSTPKNIFLKAINKGYGDVEKALTDSDTNFDDMLKGKIFEASYTFDADVKLADGLLDDETMKVIDLINDLDMGLDVAYDDKTKNMDMSLSLKDAVDSLELGAYIRDKEAYIDLNDLYSKYIKMALEVSETNESINKIEVEDAKYIVSAVKDAFLKSLDGNKFKTTDYETTIDGKDVKTNKIYYTLDDKELLSVLKSTLKTLKADSKFIEKMAKISGEDKKVLTEGLGELIKELDEIDSLEMGDAKLIISVYTNGILDNVIGYGIEISDSEANAALVYFDYKDIVAVKLLSNNIPLVNLTSKKVKANEYKTVVTALTAKLTIDTKTKGDNSDSTFSLTESSSGLDVSGNLKTTTKEKSKDKEYEGNVEMNVAIKVEDEEMASIKVASDYTLNIGGKLEEISTNNSVDAEKMTEADATSIMNKLEANGIVKKLVEVFESVEIEDDYDYDYDYDYDTDGDTDYVVDYDSDYDFDYNYLSCSKYSSDTGSEFVDYYYGDDNKITTMDIDMSFYYDSNEEMLANYDNIVAKYPESLGYGVSKGYTIISVEATDIAYDGDIKDVNALETAKEKEGYSCYIND